MSYGINRRLGGLRFDRVSLTFGLLLIVVTGIGIGLYEVLAGMESVEPVTNDMSSSEQAAAGVGWAISEAAFAGLMLLTALAWKRLPDAIQSTLKTVAKTGLLLAVGGAFASSGNFPGITLALLGMVGVVKAADEYGLFWMINDVFVVGVAVYLAAFAGYVLSPWLLAAALVGLSIYDHVFANKRSWMFELMKPMVKLRLPILFLVPTKWRFDWESLADITDESDGAPDTVGFGIGMADLALPSAFVVSVYNSLPQTAVSVVTLTVVAGLLVACARMSWEMQEHGSGAGLPPLTGGALGGWIVGSAWVVIFL